MASIPNRCEYAVIIFKTLGEEAFLHLSIACQLNHSCREATTDTSCSTPGNRPTLKAASGKTQRTLQSLTRLASLQTQMQQRDYGMGRQSPLLLYLNAFYVTIVVQSLKDLKTAFAERI